MVEMANIFAAGFGRRQNGDKGKIVFSKAFRRKTGKNPNCATVDDMVSAMVNRGIYNGGGVHILLSEIAELEKFKSQLEVLPHNDALEFIRDAQSSGNPLDEYVIVIMTSEAMNTVQADLLRKADKL